MPLYPPRILTPHPQGSNPVTTSSSATLSRELRTEMWLALAQRLQGGEAVYSNAQFCHVLLEIFQELTGQEPPEGVRAEVTTMVETVNREHRVEHHHVDAK